MKLILLCGLLCLFCLAPTDKKEASQSHTVAIKGMQFDPAEVKIAVGDSIAWSNKDDRDHTVAAIDKSFKSQNISKNGTFEHKFTKAGTFSYGCSYHPRMKGIVIVSGN